MQTSVQVITTSSHALHNSLSKTSYINLTSREFTCSTSSHHHLYAFLKLRNQTTFCCHIPQTSQSLVLAQLCRPKLKGFYHLHNIRARYTLPVEQQTNHVNLSNIPSDGSHSNTIQSYQLRKAGLHATTPSLHQSSPHAFQPPPKAIQTRTTPIESPPPPLYPSLPIHIAPAQPAGATQSESPHKSSRSRGRGRTFLHVLAGRALAEDLREPPLQRMLLRLRRRLAAVRGLGIHGGAVGPFGHAIAQRGHRIGGAPDRGRGGEGTGRMRGSDAATEEGRRSGRRGKDGVGCDERDGVEESQVMWGRGDGGPLCLWRCLPPLSPLLAFVRVRSGDDMTDIL
jgi:hypothetical protein